MSCPRDSCTIRSLFPFPRQEGTRRRCGAIVKGSRRPEGGARLTYRLPSHVFAPYQVPALDKMARELDAIFARIVAAATG